MDRIDLAAYPSRSNAIFGFHRINQWVFKGKVAGATLSPWTLHTVLSLFLAVMSSSPPPQPKLNLLPAFDNTLGALHLGSGIATILYGVGCLQFFVYVTARRSQFDQWRFKLFVFVLLRGLETTHQALMMAGMYRFLVTDYMNPAALPTGGPGSGEQFIYVQSLVLSSTALLTQLFFCWRIWMFSVISFKKIHRVGFSVLTVSLALFSFGSNIDLSVMGYNHRLLTGNGPDILLAYKLSTASGVAFDVIITAAMTLNLHLARAGTKRSDHVITLIMLFTVNTNLVSTVLAISALVTFLALPRATVYGGIGFLLGKTYFNSFMAVLNSREFLREKIDETMSISSNRLVVTVIPMFTPHDHGTTAQTSTVGGEYELSGDDMRPSDKRPGTGNYSDV
ncbi:hypothetical protein FPV67DRAFT_434500 [Lyophyllum atratum]|nr:hypothetical protein FPV67DRAFT_434500 [Lyophyllum atratum]